MGPIITLGYKSELACGINLYPICPSTMISTSSFEKGLSTSSSTLASASSSPKRILRFSKPIPTLTYSNLIILEGKETTNHSQTK